MQVGPSLEASSDRNMPYGLNLQHSWTTLSTHEHPRTMLCLTDVGHVLGIAGILDHGNSGALQPSLRLEDGPVKNKSSIYCMVFAVNVRTFQERPSVENGVVGLMICLAPCDSAYLTHTVVATWLACCLFESNTYLCRLSNYFVGLAAIFERRIGLLVDNCANTVCGIVFASTKPCTKKSA
jgi:hypothetical protein